MMTDVLPPTLAYVNGTLAFEGGVTPSSMSESGGTLTVTVPQVLAGAPAARHCPRAAPAQASLDSGRGDVGARSSDRAHAALTPDDLVRRTHR